MSDTESETSTILESLPFETILENLSKAASDAIETGDYLSYSTVLDVYFADRDHYSYEQRDELLQSLLDVLTANKDLVYEIGWDIPSLIIDYFESDYDFELSLRKSPCSYRIFKIFEILAIDGNSKELFLKSCELMTSLDIEDITFSDDMFAKEKILELKVYCLFELVSSCLTKIETLYPSRFLAMFSTAIINFVEKNYSKFESHRLQYILRRIYTFARSYGNSTAPLTNVGKDLTEKELKEIKADEDYLTRKLLRLLISETIVRVGENWSPMNANLLFNKLSNKTIPPGNDGSLLGRFHELCISFDIDFKEVQTDFLVSTSKLFHGLNFKQLEDEVTSQIFELVVKDYQENFFIPLIDSKEIKISPLGLLIYQNHYFVNNSIKSCNIPLKDSILTTIRLIVPMIVEAKYNNKALHDLAVSWNWISLTTAINDLGIKGVKLQLSAIPQTLLKTYFSCLIFILTKNSDNWYQGFRFTVLTLMTKMLTLTPEQLAYDFLRDSISDCPFHEYKPSLVGILKELLTKDKLDEENKVDELSESLKSTKIDEKPPLPSRDIKVSSKFLTLNDSRFNEILSLINKTHKDCFPEVTEVGSDTENDEKNFKINYPLISPLSSLFNLLVVLKNDESFSSNKEKVDSLVDKWTKDLKSIKDQYKENLNDVRVTELLILTLERV